VRTKLLPGLDRLLDFRSPEQRGVALVRYDFNFAQFQKKHGCPPDPWEEIRKAIDRAQSCSGAASWPPRRVTLNGAFGPVG